MPLSPMCILRRLLISRHGIIFGMEKLDGRKISREALEEIRIRAVKQVEDGASPEDVIAALGMHRSCIYEWLALYREGGVEALRSRKAPGKAPKLDGKQMRELYGLITGFNPQQLNFEFALWTRAMVRELIRDHFGVRLSEVSVGRLLRKIGLSPQKPLYRASQRDESLVDHWREMAFPEIQKEAKKCGAQVYFADEASVRSDYHSGTTWAPVGETPVVESSGARFGVNLISAVSPSGSFRFMAIEGKMNAGVFIEFLKRLLAGSTRAIFLIVDGHPVHKSRAVKEYVAKTGGRLRLFVLPPYSPHLNPDEWAWAWLKKHQLGRRTVGSKDEFTAMVKRQLRRLQKLPEIVKGFFRDPNLAYINNVG